MKWILRSRVEWRKSLFIAILTVFVSVLLFLFLYRFDNKYNTSTPQPRGGILLLDEAALDDYPIIHLVNGWELYYGLLSPEELRSDPLRSGKSIFIGQITGFEIVTPDASPHGSATLMLNISVPEERRVYALELPEIYSAYRLYINGEMQSQMGDPAPDSFTPFTGNNVIMFTAGGNIEIVLAVTDHKHIYSGLVYPPAFGQPQAVQMFLATKLVVRAAVIAVALALGLFNLALGLTLRSRGEGGGYLTILFGLLCFCFFGAVSYPVIKTIWPGGLGWYTFEMFCYCAMLLLVMLIVKSSDGQSPADADTEERDEASNGFLISIKKSLYDTASRIAWLFPAFGVMVCLFVLFLPLIARGGQATQAVWSELVSIYFIVCAVYITAAALYGIMKNRVNSRVLLCGAMVFDTALFMDRLLPHFEPVYTGWFSEWAGAVLVTCFGILIALDILRQYRQRRALESNLLSMTQLMETQQAYYPLVMEQAEQARAARHDLRHHMLAVQGFTQRSDYGALDKYLLDFGHVTEPSPLVFCGHPVLNMLLSLFAAQADAAGVRFTALADVPDTLDISDPDLFAIVTNLLENALEAACHLKEEQREIQAGIRIVSGSLVITVDNTFDGFVDDSGGRLFSRKRPGQPGVGTASVRRIATSNGGWVSYRWEQMEHSCVFHAEVIIPIGM